jgi:hypothetical protein
MKTAACGHMEHIMKAFPRSIFSISTMAKEDTPFRIVHNPYSHQLMEYINSITFGSECLLLQTLQHALLQMTYSPSFVTDQHIIVFLSTTQGINETDLFTVFRNASQTNIYLHIFAFGPMCSELNFLQKQCAKYYKFNFAILNTTDILLDTLMMSANASPSFVTSYPFYQHLPPNPLLIPIMYELCHANPKLQQKLIEILHLVLPMDGILQHTKATPSSDS